MGQVDGFVASIGFKSYGVFSDYLPHQVGVSNNGINSTKAKLEVLFCFQIIIIFLLTNIGTWILFMVLCF